MARPTKQSDLSAFINKGATASSSSATAKRRTTRSSSATSAEPSSKRVKRETPVEEQEEEEEDVKPKVEGDEHPDARAERRDRRLQSGERGTVPPEAASTPLAHLYDAMRALAAVGSAEEKPPKDGVVVYWSRNKDLRLTDNTALSHASELAQSLSLPLLAMHIFSPGDYQSHDRSPRRLDFQLRQLGYLQTKLDEMDIPLFTFSHDKRKDIPRALMEKLEEWGAVACYANLEYEVDELRRDVEVVERTRAAKESGEGWKGKVDFLHDFCIVQPGVLLTKQGKPYSVYSPYQRSWAAHIDQHTVDYLVQQNPPLKPNDHSARKHPILSPFFSHTIPTEIEGFELADEEEKERMKQLWPVGEGVPDQVLRRFMRMKVKEGKFDEAPVPGEEDEEVGEPEKESRIGVYTEGRNRIDWDGTSHLSPYLAVGLLSGRDCLRAAHEVTSTRTLASMGRDSGVGFWIMEMAWRDFYQHILCFFPRVCMSLPWNLKYNETIEWARSEDGAEEHFEAWKEGRTGVPIVDAAMRAMKEQGYMHNRGRMIVASYLSKDLLIDWRRGERYFMQQLIDGDLGANNGGWAWAASVGCDPQPYFRIFNPFTQSEKVDPEGKYIRHWVPELKSIKGKAIHNPSSTLSAGELKKLGYLAPIVDHAKARTKAIEVYKAAAQKGA
ncbi:hypothetical protein JCM11641_005008 [Rhodosporidiobolus odoratus]